MNDTIKTLAILLYNFGLLAGTVYLIQFHDWSMWTFILTALFFITTSKSTS